MSTITLNDCQLRTIYKFKDPAPIGSLSIELWEPSLTKPEFGPRCLVSLIYFDVDQALEQMRLVVSGLEQIKAKEVSGE